MAKLDSPDLRKMLVGLARLVNRRIPGTVLDDEIKRLEDASNVLLIVSRIMAAMSKRHAKVESSEIKKLAERSQWVVDSADIFDVETSTDGVITGSKSVWDVLCEVDKALNDPECRSKIPEWFVNDLWPGTLRRIAQGKKMSDREKSIALYVISVASGER